MRQRTVVEITAENHIEEQLLLEEYPEAVWVNLDGNTRFYLPEDRKIEGKKGLSEEYYKKGGNINGIKNSENGIP